MALYFVTVCIKKIWTLFIVQCYSNRSSMSIEIHLTSQFLIRSSSFQSLQVGAISCLAIGIYTHEVEYGSRQMSNLIGVSMYRADSVMMIAGGSAIIAITLLGFIGVYKQHRCMVGMVSFHLIIGSRYHSL